MGTNFIGPKQVNLLLMHMGKELISEIDVPEVNYDEETLRNSASDYILVYGTDALDILDIRNFFGVDPEISEPCLYNQDWYMSEEFIRRRIDNKWFLIKRNVLEDTRAVMPMEIISTGVKFPSAILCVYLFSLIMWHTEKCFGFTILSGAKMSIITETASMLVSITM